MKVLTFLYLCLIKMTMLILEALGYKVSIVEYISPTETPKNLMLRAVKTQGPDEKALAEYKKLKEMLGLTQHWKN